MKKLVIALALTVVAAPAFAESLPEKTGVNSTLGISSSTPDFVNSAAISDMFEIQSSELAVERTTGATRKFATEMVSAHKKTTAELKGLVAKDDVKVSPVAKLDDAHQEKLDKLKSLKGDDFAEQYRSDQVAAHEDAVSLFQRYSEGGDNAALKSWAGKTLPTLQHHLDMAKKLEK